MEFLTWFNTIPTLSHYSWTKKIMTFIQEKKETLKGKSLCGNLKKKKNYWENCFFL